MAKVLLSTVLQQNLVRLDEKLSKLGLKRQDVDKDSFYNAVERQFDIKKKSVNPNKLRSKCAKDEKHVDAKTIQAAASLLDATITVTDLDKEDSVYNPKKLGKNNYRIHLARVDDVHFYSVEKAKSIVTLRSQAQDPKKPSVKSSASSKKSEEPQKETVKEPANSSSSAETNPPAAHTDAKVSVKPTSKAKSRSAAENKGKDNEKTHKTRKYEDFETQVEQEAEERKGFFLHSAIKIAKFISTLVFFGAVLFGGIATKSTLLVLGNAYSQDYSSSTCPTVAEGKVNAPYFSRYMVMLILMSCLCFPEVVSFLYSFWKIIKKNEEKMRWSICLLGMIPEVFHAVGLTFLTLKVIPNIDATLASLMFSLIALNPSARQILATYAIWKDGKKNARNQEEPDSVNRPERNEKVGENGKHAEAGNTQKNKSAKKSNKKNLKYFILSISAMPLILFGYIILGWQIYDTVDGDRIKITICAIASLFLMSTRCWENFMLLKKKKSKGKNPASGKVNEANDQPNSNDKIEEEQGFSLAKLQLNMEKIRFKTSVIYSIVRLCVIVFCCFLIHFVIEKNKAVVEYRRTQPVYFRDARINTKCSTIVTSLWLAGLANCLCSLGTFMFGFIACQARVQRASFVLPLALITPFMSLLTASYTLFGVKRGETLMEFFNMRVKHSFVSQFVGWKTMYQDIDPPMMAAIVIVGLVTGYLGLIFATSYAWDENDIAIPMVEDLFVKPIYAGPLINEMMLLNRQQVGATRRLVEKEQRKFVPRVFLCTTMWHETEREMTQILTSIMRLDQFRRKIKEEDDEQSKEDDEQSEDQKDPDFFKFEVHVFFDDAIEWKRKIRVNDHVTQYLRLIPKAADTVKSESSSNICFKSLLQTPYGGRIKIRLPNNNSMYIHLKDACKIRKKKRWSQCMYMHYILRYLPQVKNYRMEDMFILALDGDVEFHPMALVYVLDIMKKDSNVGAACGRIHPTGNGPVVWFQKFEYAVGHWLQKTAEDVLGCVLCSPGCFSLFRGSSLIKKNVAGTYMQKASEPLHEIQWDQGEDRWLCTLLLKQGSKIEYCAASDSYTFAPEEFKEFYNQRRRWSPSTVANVFDILLNAKLVVKNNENISWGYIAYQMGLMVSSLLGPSTVVLVVQGSLQYVFGMNSIGALLTAVIPVIVFIIICYTAKPAFQIVVAGILTVAYALVMMAVLVGVIGQMAESLLNPSSLFMWIMIGIYTFTGLIHPREILCLLHGLIYYLCVPSAFIFLPIYSYCNMDNVSWGTREDPKPKKRKGNSQQTTGNNGEKSMSSMGPNTEEGNYGCGWGNMCRCLVCVNPASNQEYQSVPTEEPRTDENKPAPRTRWNNLQQRYLLAETFFMGEEDSTDEEVKKRDASVYFKVESPLKGVGISKLDDDEKEFWEKTIKKDLEPIKYTEEKKRKERMEPKLSKLKNKMSGAYFFINSLWLVLTFSLTLVIHDVNITLYDRYGNETVLNPLAFLFLVFFIVILLIQFTAMIFHRWSTFIHLMAKTNFCNEKDKECKNTTGETAPQRKETNAADKIDGPSTSSSENKATSKGTENQSFVTEETESGKTAFFASNTSRGSALKTFAKMKRQQSMVDIVLQKAAEKKRISASPEGGDQTNTGEHDPRSAGNASVSSADLGTKPKQGEKGIKLIGRLKSVAEMTPAENEGLKDIDESDPAGGNQSAVNVTFQQPGTAASGKTEEPRATSAF